MNPEVRLLSVGKRPRVVAGVIKRLSTILVFLALISTILFVSAGRTDWTWAWVYIGIGLGVMVINGALLLRTRAETIAERGEARITQTWDKLVTGVYIVALYLALPVVAGLDQRLGWTPDPGIAVHVAGAVLCAAGYELTSWAMLANAFFSTVVRIQSERGHTVCGSGPYRFVRHPGYVGTILQTLSLPVLFGSWWALIPAITGAGAIVARTIFEDRTLQAELAGYKDYVQKVHYRLIPGLW